MYDGPTEREIRAKARHLIRTLGPNRAAQILGVCREAGLALGADAPVTRGTLAVAGQRIRDLDLEMGGA